MGTSVLSIVYLTLEIHKPGAVVGSGSPTTKLESEIISNANTTRNHAAKTRLEHDFSEKTEYAVVRDRAGESPTVMILLRRPTLPGANG